MSLTIWGNLKIRIESRISGDQWIVDIDDYPKYVEKALFKELERAKTAVLKPHRGEVLVSEFRVFVINEP